MLKTKLSQLSALSILVSSALVACGQQQASDSEQLSSQNKALPIIKSPIAKIPSKRLPAKKLRSRYSGQQIFSGVFLANGKVVYQLPKLWDADQIKKSLQKTNQRKLAKQRKILIDTINKQNPEFFKEFGQLMQSGNPKKVDHAMTLATQNLNLAFKKIYKKNKPSAVRHLGYLFPDICEDLSYRVNMRIRNRMSLINFSKEQFYGANIHNKEISLQRDMINAYLAENLSHQIKY